MRGMRMPDGPGLSPAGTWPSRPPGPRRSSSGPGTGAAPVYPVTAAPRQRPGKPPHREASREVVLVGAHGGAGVTTLAGLLRPAWDMGAVWRPGPDRGPLRPAGRPVLLVTRNTVAAAGRAVTAARLLDEQGVQVTVLV